jgi:hypothetical protein
VIARNGSTASFGPPDELVARRKNAFNETDAQTIEGEEQTMACGRPLLIAVKRTDAASVRLTLKRHS